MKGVPSTSFLLLSVWFFFTEARNCATNDDCQFHSECVNEHCSCNVDCTTLGYLILCGEDGSYYFNYCYLVMASCGIQSEIRLHEIGFSEHCSSHKLHPGIAAIQDTLPDHTACQQQGSYCNNFGVCVQQNERSQFCLCPPGFGGSRCENKVDTDSPTIYTVRGRQSATVGDDVSDGRSCDVIILTLLLCVVTAMISSVVTAAICHRSKTRKIRKVVQELRKPEELLAQTALQPKTNNSSETETSV